MEWEVHNRVRNRAGFTLIELVITISIMAMITSIAVVSLVNITGNNLKTMVSKLAGTIRYSYDLAARKGVSFRLVFDLDEQSYWVESSSEKFLLDREKTEVSEGKAQPKEEDSHSRSTRFLRRSDIEDGELWQPKGPPAFSSFAGRITDKVILPSDQVHFKDVWVDHQADRVTAGQAYLYFFPNGLSERAIIHLTNEDDDVFAIEVEPLTGRVIVHSQYLEIPGE